MDRRSFLLACGAGAAGLTGCREGTTHAATTSPSGTARGRVPEVRDDAVDIQTGSFASRHRRGRRTNWLLLYPYGHHDGERMPVLITLHGTGSGEDTPWVLKWAKNSARLRAEGFPPFACVGVTGGDTWWHRRADGSDSGAMITQELMPMLARRGLDVRRPAFYGYSMGGVGALLLGASRGRAGTSSVVAASTPFLTSSRQLRGAFDSDADFRAHDLHRLWPRLAGVPVRLDVGDRDPFLAQNREFVKRVRPAPELHIARGGGHDRAYWGQAALDQLRFVARHF